MRVTYRITSSLVLATYVLLVTGALFPHERAVTLPSETGGHAESYGKSPQSVMHAALDTKALVSLQPIHYEQSRIEAEIRVRVSIAGSSNVDVLNGFCSGRIGRFQLAPRLALSGVDV